jgi:ribonuclease HI
LLNKIWSNKKVTPRVQTFGWRLLSKAIPTGLRAGKYSKHISKLCSRCGLEESDLHLFFTCNFARAAWFTHPWYIRTDCLIHNASTITDVILTLTNINHPHASLSNILTFMWCLWKARNDNLFNRGKTFPTHIHIRAHSIMQNLEMADVMQGNRDRDQPGKKKNQNAGYLNKQHPENQLIHQDPQDQDFTVNSPLQGSTITTVLHLKGDKIFLDASWKNNETTTHIGSRVGIGILLQLHTTQKDCKVRIQASSRDHVSSPLQAEALALVFAANLAHSLQLHGVQFLTDNLTLAKAATTDSLVDQMVPWQIRNAINSFRQVSTYLRAAIYHINRKLNKEADDCAHKALQTTVSEPIVRCICSAHSNKPCPIFTSLQSLNMTCYILHSVICD